MSLRAARKSTLRFSDDEFDEGTAAASPDHSSTAGTGVSAGSSIPASPALGSSYAAGLASNGFSTTPS